MQICYLFSDEIHITDILFYIFYGYIVINWFCKNGHPDIRWWLTLLILPLYAAIRLVSANVVFRRWFSIVFLFFVLTEAVWGLLQLYGVTHSYHYIYKVTGSLFNSGPFSGFVAVGVPLALAYAFDKSVTRWEKRLGLITLPIVVLALIFSMSRAAWLASVAGCSSILWKQFQSSKLQFQIVNSKFFKSAANHFSHFFIRILMVIASGFLIIILLCHQINCNLINLLMYLPP